MYEPVVFTNQRTTTNVAIFLKIEINFCHFSICHHFFKDIYHLCDLMVFHWCLFMIWIFFRRCFALFKLNTLEQYMMLTKKKMTDKRDRFFCVWLNNHIHIEYDKWLDFKFEAVFRFKNESRLLYFIITRFLVSYSKVNDNYIILNWNLLNLHALNFLNHQNQNLSMPTNSRRWFFKMMLKPVYITLQNYFKNWPVAGYYI